MPSNSETFDLWLRSLRWDGYSWDTRFSSEALEQLWVFLRGSTFCLRLHRVLFLAIVLLWCISAYWINLKATGLKPKDQITSQKKEFFKRNPLKCRGPRNKSGFHYGKAFNLLYGDPSQRCMNVLTIFYVTKDILNDFNWFSKKLSML